MSETLEHPSTASERCPYVWDYNLTRAQFRTLLNGQTLGRLDRDWAALRVIEYAPYAEMIRLLGYRGLAEGWPHWRTRVRADDQRRALDFVVEWMTQYHPELLVSDTLLPSDER